MFNPESEVPSLELCKKLKDLGYPQDGGGWYWVKTDWGEWCLMRMGDERNYLLEGEAIWDVDEAIEVYSDGVGNTELRASDIIKAPTIAEMWEWLPFIINGGEDIDDLRERYGFLSVRKYDNGLSIVSWLNMYNKYHSRIPQFFGVSLGNNMAEALIWLAENGYVRFEDD